MKNSQEVLNAFASHKLDDITDGPPKKRQKLNEISAEMETTEEKLQENVYFAKYLTSQKVARILLSIDKFFCKNFFFQLLQLQLNDNNFRRYVLVQFLILFQYLTADVKFKE